MRGVKLTGHNARNYHGERVFVRGERFARFWRFTRVAYNDSGLDVDALDEMIAEARA